MRDIGARWIPLQVQRSQGSLSNCVTPTFVVGAINGGWVKMVSIR